MQYINKDALNKKKTKAQVAQKKISLTKTSAIFFSRNKRISDEMKLDNRKENVKGTNIVPFLDTRCIKVRI